MSTQVLFTFFVEYKGGTYTSQIYASSVELAVKKWIADEMANIAKLSGTSPLCFEKDFGVEEVVAVKLDQCVNVWCITRSVDGKFLLVNVVATAEGMAN